MKGVVFIALKEIVKDRYGDKVWDNVLKEANLSREPIIFPISDVEDTLILNIIGAILKVLNMNLHEFAEIFGGYWIKEYANKVYNAFFRDAKSAKDLILKVDDIHKYITKNMKNASPPRFRYEDRGNKIIIEYISKRGLIELAIGIAKAVGDYYDERIKVNKVSDDKFEIIFS